MSPVRVLGNQTIVTNGDQTDTVYEGVSQGKSFAGSLESRKFEPDAPNYTPRISAVLTVENGACSYEMSILKSSNGNPDECLRYTFSYDAPQPGEGALSIPIRETAIPFQALRGSRSLWIFRMTAGTLRKCSGKA